MKILSKKEKLIKELDQWYDRAIENWKEKYQQLQQTIEQYRREMLCNIDQKIDKRMIETLSTWETYFYLKWSLKERLKKVLSADF